MEYIEALTGYDAAHPLLDEQRIWTVLVALFKTANEQRGRIGRDWVLPVSWPVHGIFALLADEGAIMRRLDGYKVGMPAVFKRAKGLTVTANFSDTRALLLDVDTGVPRKLHDLFPPFERREMPSASLLALPAPPLGAAENIVRQGNIVRT